MKPKITGTDLMCSSASFEVGDLPSWSNSIIWEQSSNLTRTSAQGANPCTFAHNGDGEGWIKARIVTTFNDTIDSSIKTVWVGVPVVNAIDGASSTTVDETEGYHASYDEDCDPYGFFWGAYPYYQGLTVSPSSGYDWTYITFPEADNYTVVTQLQNTCGWSSYAYKSVSVSGSKSATIENSASPEIPDGTGNNISLYPNPAKKEVTISIGSKLLMAGKDIQYWDLEVYNPAQVLVYKKVGLKSPETGINTQGWVEGMYLVRVKIGETILNRKLEIAK